MGRHFIKPQILLFVVFFAWCTVSRAEQGYSYPLRPGTSAWAAATAVQRVNAAYVPKSFRDTASSRQLFLSAVTNPYFREILDGSAGIDNSYAAASQTSALNTILPDAEACADFGYQAFNYLHGLNISAVASAQCSQFNGPCWMDYIIVCYMAGRTTAQNTIDMASDQTLFKIAVWDANYFISLGQRDSAAADVQLMYVIYYRGSAPPGVWLPALSGSQSTSLQHLNLPSELDSTVASVKSSLGLIVRP